MTPKLWYIWSMEHGAWWKPGRRGYTQNVAEAGRYETEEALQIVHDANLYTGSKPHEAMIAAAELPDPDDGPEELLPEEDGE